MTQHFQLLWLWKPHKGIYAILLGSGVSRAASIPTGGVRKIVDDLTRRLASVEGGKIGDAWEAWYLGKFGKEPSYSELIHVHVHTEAERMSLLKGYFEPSQDEREQGKKTSDSDFPPRYRQVGVLLAMPR